jgi:hypothetical protein
VSNPYREVYGLLTCFGFLSIATLLSNVRNLAQIRPAQKTPSGSAISLIKAIIWGESIDFLVRILDVCFQNTRKSSRCHREIHLWLENEERQEQPVSFPVGESFQQSTQDVQVVPRQRIFGQPFSLASRQSGKRAQEKGDRR